MTATDAAAGPGRPSASPAAGKVVASLRRRHAKERNFRLFGLAAVILGLGFVAILFASILVRGVPAFWQAVVVADVYFDPAVVKIEDPPVREAGESDAAFEQRRLAWETRVTMVNWNRLIEQALLRLVPDGEGKSRDLLALVSSSERYELRDMVVADPGIVGRTVRMELLASANVDVWLKGNIDRSLPDGQQALPAATRAWADQLRADGAIEMVFSRWLFLNVDSRSAPAAAGLAGAFVGSLYMMLIVVLLSVPIGVASAIYLEEFAPKNRLTDLIEVNINNLAAVPSIVFGLLGAAVFINYMKLPLSAPLVGGLVLTLMTLPTIIIATRSTLRAVPPSIKEAALGVGASPVQAVFHHVLPVAVPGILTATIIGVAQALGETAPLLLIGMSAFVANIPATPLDQSTALPVQVYLWQGNELRNFFESRTSAAIIVLLALMILLNFVAIVLRQRFQRRW